MIQYVIVAEIETVSLVSEEVAVPRQVPDRLELGAVGDFEPQQQTSAAPAITPIRVFMRVMTGLLSQQLHRRSNGHRIGLLAPCHTAPKRGEPLFKKTAIGPQYFPIWDQEPRVMEPLRPMFLR
jgi:hypothetical protein